MPAHQLLQARFLRARELPQARHGKAAVLVHEGHDIGDGRDRDEVEVPRERLRGRAEQRLPELPDHPGAAELRERVVAAIRPDHGAVGELRPRTVVVGDHHVEPERSRMRDLVDGRNPAVDGQDEPAALLGEARDRLSREPVALVEAARQMPRDVGAELAEDEDGQGGRADPVGVVVAVDADLPSLCDGTPNRLTGRLHVAEPKRVVFRQLGGEEFAGPSRVCVSAPYEDGRESLTQPEIAHESFDLVSRAVGAQLPVRLLHGQSTVRRPPDGRARTHGANRTGRRTAHYASARAVVPAKPAPPLTVGVASERLTRGKLHAEEREPDEEREHGHRKACDEPRMAPPLQSLPADLRPEHDQAGRRAEDHDQDRREDCRALQRELEDPDRHQHERGGHEAREKHRPHAHGVSLVP